MSAPIWTVEEWVSGAWVPASGLDFGQILLGANSAVKRIRIYNDKAGSGSSTATSTKLTLKSLAGTNDTELVGGVSPNFKPYMKGLAKTPSYSSVMELLGTGGASPQQNWDLDRGAAGTYVADSGVVGVENTPSVLAANGESTAVEWTFMITAGGADEDNPAVTVASIVAAIGEVEYSYDTTDATITDGVYIALDPDNNYGKPDPATDPEQSADIVYTYRKDIPSEDWTVTSATPAQLHLNNSEDAPANGKRIWMNYNYIVADTVYEYVGGDTYQMDIGGATTTIADEESGLDYLVAEIPSEAYAECDLQFQIPSGATPSSNLGFLLRIVYQYA